MSEGPRRVLDKRSQLRGQLGRTPMMPPPPDPWRDADWPEPHVSTDDGADLSERLAELDEPTELELACMCPDRLADPPEDWDQWLAGLSAEELDEILGRGDPHGAQPLVGAGFADGGVLDTLDPGPVL